MKMKIGINVKIVNFLFDQNANVASWSNGATQVMVQQLRQACCDEEQGVVFGLPTDFAIQKINVFDYTGTQTSQLNPLNGFQLEYLLEDVTYGIRAVCSQVNASGDTLDWYFKIDLSTGNLIKQGRAY